MKGYIREAGQAEELKMMFVDQLIGIFMDVNKHRFNGTFAGGWDSRVDDNLPR
jgi:hypothetical protein